MALKVITFDFWNTIFDSSNGSQRNELRLNAVRSEALKLGKQIDRIQIDNAINASWGFFVQQWKEKLRTPDTREMIDFFWQFAELPYSPESIDRIEKVFAESILTIPPNPVAGVIEATNALSQDFRLAIVSDTGFSPGVILRQLLGNVGVLDKFSAFSFSNETGVAKPHPKAFLSVLDELHVGCHESLHIGDIEETDIKGAKALSMGAIRFTGDLTAKLVDQRRPHTDADADFSDWKSIVEYIYTNKK